MAIYDVNSKITILDGTRATIIEDVKNKIKPFYKEFERSIPIDKLAWKIYYILYMGNVIENSSEVGFQWMQYYGTRRMRKLLSQCLKVGLDSAWAMRDDTEEELCEYLQHPTIYGEQKRDRHTLIRCDTINRKVIYYCLDMEKKIIYINDLNINLEELKELVHIYSESNQIITQKKFEKILVEPLNRYKHYLESEQDRISELLLKVHY